MRCISIRTVRVTLLVLVSLTAVQGYGQVFQSLGALSTNPVGDLTICGTTLYGMTLNGGTQGTIFSVGTDGSGYRTLLSFTGSGGAYPGQTPYGNLTLSGSSLYGMTFSGGSLQNGNVFSVGVDGGNFQNLATFTGRSGTSPGLDPYGSLTLCGSTLYGMTNQGSTNGYGYGNLFSVGTNGTGFRNLVGFTGATGAAPGLYPFGNLTLSGTTLYGMTVSGGGSYCGNIFGVGLDGNSFRNVLAFSGASGSIVGGYPQGSLLLSGTTLYGMTTEKYTNTTIGKGTIFSVGMDGTNFTNLVSFTGKTGSYLGQEPYGSLTLVGTNLYGTTYYGGSSDWGEVFSVGCDGSGFNSLVSFTGLSGAFPGGNPRGSLSLNVPAADLSSVANATIITGGTAVFSPAVANSATSSTLYGTTRKGGAGNLGTAFSLTVSGANSLHYTLSAAMQSGSAAISPVSPASGSLAPGTSQSCTVSATSTSLGCNTIAFTANDPSWTNPSRTTTATLTVLDHAAGRAVVTAGNGFVAHAGAMGVTASIALSNAAGTRSELEIGAASIGSGTLSGPTTVYWLSAGSSQLYAATFNAGTTAGTLSDTATFTAGDRQSMSGANLLGTLCATFSGSVFSGRAIWTSSDGSAYGDGANWTDLNAQVHAAPGTFGGFADTDVAAFTDSATVTTVSLNRANPSLAALVFSGLDYTLIDGALTLASTSGMPVIRVDGSTTQTISSSIEGSQGLWKSGPGTLVLGGSNNYTGGTFVADGQLVIANPSAIANGSALSVGGVADPGADINLDPVVAAGIVASVPEPSCLALLLAGGLCLMACARRRTGQESLR